ATTGGVTANAVVELLVPANWAAPQKTTDNAAGYTTASYNDGSNHAIASSNISITGQTVDVTVPVALASGSTLTITYGDTGSSSSGAATAPSPANAGNSVFTLKSKSTSGGTVTTLATTPQTGSSSSAGYTQANIAGGGYSTTGASASGRTVTVATASALNAGDTILVRYGDTSGSSSGAAAATHAADSGPATWTVQEKSTSGGALTSLTSGSPSVTVNPSSDGSGTASI